MDKDFFQKFSFSEGQIKQYYSLALRDLTIARQSTVPEVVFQFSYNALIKIGVAALAGKGYKVRSKTGHHTKILEALGTLLEDKEIFEVADSMRRIRNRDLYEGVSLISAKNSKEYLKFVQSVYDKAIAGGQYLQP